MVSQVKVQLESPKLTQHLQRPAEQNVLLGVCILEGRDRWGRKILVLKMGFCNELKQKFNPFAATEKGVSGSYLSWGKVSLLAADSPTLPGLTADAYYDYLQEHPNFMHSE